MNHTLAKKLVGLAELLEKDASLARELAADIRLDDAGGELVGNEMLRVHRKRIEMGE